MAATDYIQWMQAIEGQRMADLEWGTAKAKQIIISFSIGFPTQGIDRRFGIAVRNGAVTRSYVSSFFIPGQEYKPAYYPVVIIPGCTDGVWATDNTVGMYVSICLGAGSNYITPANNTWVTGSYIAPTDINNMFGNASPVTLTNIGLYADPYKTGVPPSFVVPDFAAELRRCQRYWYRGFNISGGTTSATVCSRINNRHPVPMRATPAAAIVGSPRMYDYAATPIITSLGSVSNEYAAEFDATCSAGGMTGGRAVSNYWQTENDYIAISARM